MFAYVTQSRWSIRNYTWICSIFGCEARKWIHKQGFYGKFLRTKTQVLHGHAKIHMPMTCMYVTEGRRNQNQLLLHEGWKYSSQL